MSARPWALRLIDGAVPDPAGAYDLAALGYTEHEFLLEGTAASYRLTGERTTDGRWSVEPAEQAPFATRVLLRRPADDAAFSGTVIVEWLNVSGGLDAAPDWMLAHTQILRRGHAWAGVSAQRAGIEGGGLVAGLHLKAAHPQRYAALSHPGDAWSFDIFTQAGRAIAALAWWSPGSTVSPGTAASRLLASGHSQSGAFLVTYVNAVDPLAAVFDGFLVHGRPGSGAALDTGFQPGASGAEQIREDVRVPVIVLQTETDVTLLGSGRAAQPDSDLLRNWEIAGAAHADTYLLFASGQDDGALPPARLAELLRPTSDILMGHTEFPINGGPQHHYVECAALEHLDAWVGGRAKPPSAPRLEVTADGHLRRDDRGIANGGIRTPWTDAPVAVLSGTGQRGEMFAFLFGTTSELGDAELARLYPGGQADYLARFEHSLDAAIEAGFLLPDDRAEILAVAAVSWPGSDSHAL